MKSETSRFLLFVPPLFLAYFLAIFTPLDLYWGNYESQTSTLSAVFPVLIFSFAIVLCALCLPFVFLKKHSSARYACYLSAIAILVWISSVFLNEMLGLLAGLTLETSRAKPVEILELVVWILIPIFFAVCYKKLFKSSAQLLLVMLLLLMAVTVFRSIDFITNIAVEKHAGLNSDFLSLSKSDNVIHIVLDELSSPLMNKLLERDSEVKQQLDGFTYFPRTIANYSSTLMSISSMVSATYYKNDRDVFEYVEKALGESEFFERLKSAGMRVNLHTIPILCLRVDNIPCLSIPHKSDLASALGLLDVSLLLSAPSRLKSSIVSPGHRLITNIIMPNDYGSSRYTMAHTLFSDFEAGIKVSDKRPVYLLFHSLITHSPTSLDGNCNILESKGDNALPVKMAEIECAMGHIYKLIAKLQSLGVYDNSVVIISSDHGTIPLRELRKETTRIEGVEPLQKSRTQAVLFVKPIGMRGQMAVSNAPATLIDIPSTVLTALSMPPMAASENVFELQENQTRENAYHFYRWLLGTTMDNRLQGFAEFRLSCGASQECEWTIIEN